MKVLLVPVENIPAGGFFRKRTGTFVFLRMSDASAGYHGLNPEKVYGVCHNGNVADVRRGTLVEPKALADMVSVLGAERRWERIVGVKDTSFRCTENAMKVLENGNGQTSWATQQKCTGAGNQGGGCGALLLVEEGDLFKTHSYDHGGGHDVYITFRCPQCRVLTDLPSNLPIPPNVRRLIRESENGGPEGSR